jgi:thiamine biosynthesis lipoprotein
VGVLELEDKAAITSGGYERFFEENGKIYHHILDPSTGYPADKGLISVTIVSDDGCMADGLSTSLLLWVLTEAWHTGGNTGRTLTLYLWIMKAR